ncbi:MAG: excinuclease ABC subunit C [Ignavibacteriales bacterium CG_4_9_14_3_um_filter_30_11]|nr:MAG: excinuclease ABC subunit C [Ignavibacteriales bacterium CG_4_9_14_3_um_filter_30_11]
MNEIIKTKLKNLPNNSGVYQFIDEKGKVIYIGKAKNLKNRVKSYFHTNVNSGKTLAMVNKANDLELILTDNEIEALVLENNLIKQYKPRYNINLKDDKSFPFIKITNELFPRIYSTRRIERDGSKYFGPYTSVKYMKSSLRMINSTFKIRSCKLDITDEAIENKKFKVCLDYHIKKCNGPCEGLETATQYNDMVDEVVKVLKGRTENLVEDLNLKMEKAVTNLEFEIAAEIRDKIKNLNKILERQKIVSNDFADRDVIGVTYEGATASCSIFIIRNGKLISKKEINLSIKNEVELKEVYSSAIKFFYGEFVEVPPEILLEVEPDDIELLSTWLNNKCERKFKFVVPKRSSESLSLVKMAKQNAILQLKEIQLQKMKKQGNLPYPLSALKRDLMLNKLPRKIECFDISNIQGSDSVASMVVFEDGKPKKSQYRKFIIKSVVGPDDFLSMQEVMTRRYSKVKKSGEILPELIMVDGGKGQLSSADSILNELGFKNYNIIGLAKRLEEVFIPGKSDPMSIPKTSSGLKLLQQIRNEAHRFAITFHRSRRSKRIINSELTSIEGIGEATAEQLLKSLGSLSKIKKSDFSSIAEIVGKSKANIIIRYFNEKK